MASSPAAADQIRDSQWSLKTFEAETKVWPVSQGDGVVVAVVDGGVNQDHQDLVGQVLPGADFSGGTSDGRFDADGHGTAMAGLIAGTGHGSQAGIKGLAPKAKILPVKLTSKDGQWGDQGPDFARAIKFAADHGAKVINISLGGYFRISQEARDAIKYAVSKDIVIVASAGNSGNKSLPVEYPAAFPGVMAVAAVDQQGRAWEKSTFGPEITIAGPGVDIYQATAKSMSSYGVGNGTSDATAYVSATAALIRSKYPSLSAGQVINRMIKSATPPPDGSSVPNAHYGYGTVSPAKALEPNPAVDGGPKENPLLGRAESQGAPDDGAEDPSGVPPAVPAAAAEGNQGITYTLIGAGVLFGLVLVAVCVLVVVRGRRQRRSAVAVPGAAGYPYPVPPPAGPPGQQGYGHAPPPQQPPVPPTGNPYQ
ncbi:type VII secretion-associated serine protease mycosin [Kitasatospora sp. NPDC050467]|uniref:type VII secretion-associated serine protease mycosin n=1 Tax=Kitasatospora sp. NPDC050467 TaxID=3364053 RepID=UPI0037AF3C09